MADDRYAHQLPGITGVLDLADIFAGEQDPTGIQRSVKITAADVLAFVTANMSAGAGVPLSRHGVKKDSSTDNTDAWNACVADAVGEGSFVLVDDVLPEDLGDEILIEGRAENYNCWLEGLGVTGTIIRAVAEGAGMDWNAYGNTVLYGGGGRRFSVYGGPEGSPGVAANPMSVGLLTMPLFQQVRAWNALSGDEGICLLLAATQNGQFDLVWCGGGDVALRFDAGASANVFHRPEISAAARDMVEYRSHLTSPAGQQAFTVYNVLKDGIIEAPLSTTQHMIHSTAGALNTLDGMTISVNAPAFGGTNPTGMAEVCFVTGAESAQASMIVDKCKINGGGVSGITGLNADLSGLLGAARIHVSDGSFGSMALGGKGVIMVGDVEPWFFATVTKKWDDTGVTTVIPRHERNAREFYKGGAVGDIETISQITGEANVRWYDRADGTRALGGGTGTTDGSLGRLGADGATGKVGAVTGHLATANSTWNGPHFMFGVFHMWFSAVGDLRAKNAAPTSDTDGAAVAGFLSAAAWNGVHPVWGAFHLWADSSGRLRMKSGAPTSDTDGTIVGTQS